MSADLTLAAILRLTADTDGVPAEFTKGVLHAVADGLERDAEDVLPDLVIIGRTSTDTAAAAPTQDAPVGVVKANYQWKLKDGLRHTDGRPVEWRDVTEDLVGRPVSEFTKSVFREKPVAAATPSETPSGANTTAATDANYTAVSEGLTTAGDQWKLKDGLRHTDGRAVEWRDVEGDLIGRPISEFTKSVFRRPVAASAAPAATAAPAQGVDEVSVSVDVGEDFEQLKLRDLLEDGDEWQLKPGLRHRDGREVEWREVGEELLGRPVSDFPKSVFRRPL